MKAIIALLLLVTLPVAASAQPRSQVVFAFLGLTSSDDSISASQLRVLENRLTTTLVQIAEQERFSIVVPRNRERVLEELSHYRNADPDAHNRAPLREVVSAHGLVTGEVHQLNGSVYLDVQLVQTETGATLFAYSGEFEDYEHALRASPASIYALFELDPPDEVLAALERAETEIEGRPTGSALLQPQQYTAEPELRALTGTWKGDEGLGEVTIRSDGSGTAELHSGDYMKLRVSVDDELIIIRQDEPNSPKMYLHAFPYSIAVQVVERARPMRWRFRLSEDGRSLIGSKDTTSLQIRQGRVESADNTYSRAAVWTRVK